MMLRLTLRFRLLPRLQASHDETCEPKVGMKQRGEKRRSRARRGERLE
jgi:hypothetical protein